MLFSCINIHGSDAGENSPGGDIGSNDVGAGDNIPGICPISTLEFSIIADTSICSLGPVSLCLSLSLSDGLVFSIEANLAAGDKSPDPLLDPDVCPSCEEDDDPVSRCTTPMKSLTVV